MSRRSSGLVRKYEFPIFAGGWTKSGILNSYHTNLRARSIGTKQIYYWLRSLKEFVRWTEIEQYWHGMQQVSMFPRIWTHRYPPQLRSIMRNILYWASTIAGVKIDTKMCLNYMYLSLYPNLNSLSNIFIYFLHSKIILVSIYWYVR